MLNSAVPPAGSRAIIVARFSSDLQNPLSADDQINACIAQCGKLGWTVVCAYKDEAQSGRTVRNRPGYIAAMASAEAGDADVIVATALDRIGRNARELHDARNRLADADVVIYTLDRGVMTRMEFAFLAEMAEMESEKIAQRVSFGHRAAASRGRVMGDIPYGYRAVYDGLIRSVEIDPVTSQVVVRIHRDYAAGMSPVKIAAALTREGIPSPEGKAVWSPNTILGTERSGNGLLRNPIYVGRVIFGKTTVRRDPRTGKAIKRKAAAANMITTEMPWLRILPDDLWQEVQDILSARKTAYPRESRRPDYLLSGLTKCGVCNGAYAMTTARLGCVNRRVHACTNSRRVDRQDVESVVLDGLRNRIVRSPIIEWFLPEYLREAEQAAREASSADAVRSVRLEGIDKEIENLLKQVRMGVSGYAAKLLNDNLESLGQEKARLEREARSPRIEAPPSLTADEVTAKLHGVFDKLGEALKGDERDAARARDLIRSMITEIVVTPDDGVGQRDGRSGGAVSVKVKGPLSALLGEAVLGRKTLPSRSAADMQGLPAASFTFYATLTRRSHRDRGRLDHDTGIAAEHFESEVRLVHVQEVIVWLQVNQSFAALTPEKQQTRAEACLRALKREDLVRSVGRGSHTRWAWNAHGLNDEQWARREPSAEAQMVVRRRGTARRGRHPEGQGTNEAAEA